MITILVAFATDEAKSLKVLDLMNNPTVCSPMRASVKKSFQAFNQKGGLAKPIWSAFKFRRVAVFCSQVDQAQYESIIKLMKSNLRVSMLRADGQPIRG